MKAMFLSQSYKDVNKYLLDNINSQKYEAWDYIVITASNVSQAQNYELQIQNKLKLNFLDSRTKYIVIPDLNNERIGSGGATLNVLSELKEKFKVDFTKKKILLIHSGGDSKRIPQYSACGKLFSPVPRELDINNGSTLFDELIATTSLFPSRMNAGVMIMSGDAMLLFNPLQVEFKDDLASAVSIKMDVEIGKNHGVFNTDNVGRVLEFLHKKSVEELTQKGAVDSKNQVNIDTGVIYYAGSVMEKMVSLIQVNSKTDKQLVKKYINSKIRLSLYGDFLYPLAVNADYNSYINETSEGEYCDELIECRKQIWNLLNNIKMNIICVSPAEFLHFGTTAEMLKLVSLDIENYKNLGWKRNVASNIVDKKYATYNAVVVKSQIGAQVYVENSFVKNCNIGSQTIISNISVSNENIPSGVVLSGLLLKNGKYVVRVYGSCDNPKNKIMSTSLFGKSLKDFIVANNINEKELSKDGTLWSAEIYPIADTMEQAVKYAIATYDMLYNGNSEFVGEWTHLSKKSLENSYNDVDVRWITEWNESIKLDIIENKIVQALLNKDDMDLLIENIGEEIIKSNTVKLLANIEKYSNELKSRIYLLAIKVEKDYKLINKYSDRLFGVIKEQTQINNLPRVRSALLKSVVEALPARVNFAGGWTDTPPYCIENGGTVLNASITIDGIYPIVVSVELLTERKFALASNDMKVCKDIYSRDDILNCSNPFDRVVLQKSALVAMGIVGSEDDADLRNVFDILGGGLKLTTDVINIPKGSGLGTSSILAGACIKALYEAMGTSYSIQDVSERVMKMEQIMSTGGGWQDQIGGIARGVKLITSNSGSQKLNIRNLELTDNIKKELNERFAIIYTGQRRLARNLLRSIVFSYLSSKNTTLTALDKMENSAMEMSRKLERGDIDSFAKIMNDHWLLSKQLDPETTNTCIDYIFETCKDYIDGRMICGAGGGGFLQVILKKGVTSKDLQARLSEVFADSGIAVYDCKFAY